MGWFSTTFFCHYWHAHEMALEHVTSPLSLQAAPGQATARARARRRSCKKTSPGRFGFRGVFRDVWPCMWVPVLEAIRFRGEFQDRMLVELWGFMQILGVGGTLNPKP